MDVFDGFVDFFVWIVVFVCEDLDRVDVLWLCFSMCGVVFVWEFDGGEWMMDYVLMMWMNVLFDVCED